MWTILLLLDSKVLKDFANHPNLLDNTIKFSLEIEQNKALPFLDVKLTTCENNFNQNQPIN